MHYDCLFKVKGNNSSVSQSILTTFIWYRLSMVLVIYIKNSSNMGNGYWDMVPDERTLGWRSNAQLRRGMGKAREANFNTWGEGGCKLYIHACMHTHTQVCMHMLLNVHTHMHVNTHTHVCIHAHAYACIHAHARSYLYIHPDMEIIKIKASDLYEKNKYMYM